MSFPPFTDDQFFPFIVSAALIISSVLCFHLGKKMSGMVLLFFAALALGFFIANLDHFLLLWDEQYHALVARNMTENPFKPMLYANPLVEYDYKNWSSNHIWLHKQPLFLWQMALSVKVFGFNELAVRLPSILLHAATVPMIYRIGKISSSPNAGYYGALFFAVAYYPLELVAGRFSTDHNDVSFLFYVTASFWAWFEYQASGKRKYLVLIGLFAGCAVLVKWLVGMLVYASWMTAIAFGDRVNRLTLKTYFPMAASLFISFLVFMPWQIYILHEFPVEARYEFNYNTRHFFEPVEGHGGDAWFHFIALKDLYGSSAVVPFIYLAGLIVLLKKTASAMFRLAIFSAVFITYVFYTIAATKMTSFCIIVSPFAFLGLGVLVDSAARMLTDSVKTPGSGVIFRSAAVLVICMLLLNLGGIADYHTGLTPPNNCNRQCEFDEMNVIRRLKSQLKNGKYVVFNAKARFNGHIPVMFYTGHVAYDVIPTEAQLAAIFAKNYQVAILNNDSLPPYIMANNIIVKIRL